jgi:hypothetical protein
MAHPRLWPKVRRSIVWLSAVYIRPAKSKTTTMIRITLTPPLG